MNNTLTTLRAALSALELGYYYVAEGAPHLQVMTAMDAKQNLRTLIASMEAQEPRDSDDSLLLCASDLQHSAIYDNQAEMQACLRAVADRIKSLAAQPSEPKAEPAHDDLTIAYMSGFHDGKKAKAEPVQEPLTVESAHAMGAKGAAPTEAERLLFEAWMRGHCWALDGDWNGSQYVHAHEKTGFVHGGAMNTRGLWAAWRDRAALAAPQGRKPLTEQKIYNWWSVDNGMEDCDMARLADFRQVVRAVEAALGIEGGGK